jgi:hypothetical protein
MLPFVGRLLSVFFDNTIFSFVSSPLRGGLRWGLLFFDLTLTLSYEERG